MAAGDKGLGVINVLKGVYRGATKGVRDGKAFRVAGTKKGDKIINQLNKKSGEAVNNARRKLPKTVLSPSQAKTHKNQTIRDIHRRSKSESVGNFFGGGMRDTYINMTKEDMSFGKALKQAHSTGDKLDMKKVAGTYMGASAVGRIATGGGVLKDKNGNTNLIGIPFI